MIAAIECGRGTLKDARCFMLAYAVVNGRGKTPTLKITLHVEGEVTSNDWEKLREFCLNALKSSGLLVLNLEKVSGFDYSLGIFVCLLRRTVLLMNKRLSVDGDQQESFDCVYETALTSKTKSCSLTRASGCCLWENLYTKSTLQKSMCDQSAGRFGGDCRCAGGVWHGCPHDLGP
jgi:hypothetical protein